MARALVSSFFIIVFFVFFFFVAAVVVVGARRCLPRVRSPIYILSTFSIRRPVISTVVAWRADACDDVNNDGERGNTSVPDAIDLRGDNSTEDSRNKSERERERERPAGSGYNSVANIAWRDNNTFRIIAFSFCDFGVFLFVASLPRFARKVRASLFRSFPRKSRNSGLFYNSDIQEERDIKHRKRLHLGCMYYSFSLPYASFSFFSSAVPLSSCSLTLPSRQPEKRRNKVESSTLNDV